MKRLLFFGAIGMAAFLDFAVGTLIVTGIATWWGFTPAFSHLVLGGVLAFLPDFDLIIPILMRRYARIPQHHTTIMHRPLFLIPTSAAAAWILGGPFWTLVAISAVTWHFLHDSKELGGGGIQWAYPFSQRDWGLLGAHRPLVQMPFTKWIDSKWLHPRAMSVREIFVGIVCLAVSVWNAWGMTAALSTALLFTIGTFAMWGLRRTMGSARS